MTDASGQSTILHVQHSSYDSTLAVKT